MPETFRLNRRRFCGTAAATIAATQLPLPGHSEPAENTAIRPFTVYFSDAQLVELRRRINAARWPERETVGDASQGVQLATIQKLARYWATDYNWRKVEAKLNSLPQFTTQIDGLDIHFIHVRSKYKTALPLLVTHGWPGSVIEQLNIIEPLTNPTAHGGSASDAFDLVIPSIPGYGFSGKPTTTGWDPPHIARAWVVLMKRLGYNRFLAQGGDWGAFITTVMGEQAPPELLGIHVNLPSAVPPAIVRALACGDPPPRGLSADEARAFRQLRDFRTKHIGYLVQQSTRPQTIYEVADSPVGLASWMIDHDLRSYVQISRAFVDAHPTVGLKRDAILDNITLYWLTNTAISSARLYWENKAMHSTNAANVNIPAAVSVFPDEIYQAPRSWVEGAYHKLIYYNKVERGGHFAAWEQPLLFAQEVRTGFKPLRKVT